MASIRNLKRGKKPWQVRWREPGLDKEGKPAIIQRGDTFSTRDVAEIHFRRVRKCEELGTAFVPEHERDPVPSIGAGVNAYATDLERTLEPLTIERYKSALKLFARFLDESYDGLVTIDRLSEDMLKAFYDWLAVGLHKKRRALYTKERIVEKVQGAWAWLFDKEWSEHVPRPRKIDMKKKQPLPVRAPTFEEMARCVKACTSEGPRRLATILYYLGVRTDQARTMTWDLVDLDAGLITIPPHKGLPGRVIPMSPFLAAELARWGTREGAICGWARVHQLVERRLNEAWRRAGIRPSVWTRAPGKAFRRGLTTGLAKLGVERERAELYVGRAVEGARVHYLDVGALPLEDVAAKIPSIESFNIAPLKAKGRVA